MENNIDIKENLIYQLDKELLDILLKDRSSKKNIIWATDNYASRGYGYQEFDTITVESITGRNGLVIKPRIEKSKKEQQIRVKDKAEVFTPSWICNKMANDLDNAWFEKENVFNIENGQSWVVNHEKIVFSNKEGKTWQDYIKLKTMEISCGEAPYLVSRYDTVTGEWIDIENRIGMLDRKLRVVNENTETEVDWYKWVVEAYKATFGFEWQGDSLLIARENLLFTFIDYYCDKFKKNPENEILIEIAEILSWNIWQMDGLKLVIPNSCKPVPKMQMSFFEEDNKLEECMACKKGNKHNHTGIYCKIKNWNTKRAIKFINIKGESKMKFDFIVGNPPYQIEAGGTSTSDKPIYHLFFNEAFKISDKVILITPARFLFNAGATPKEWNKKMLNDNHFKVIKYYTDSSYVFKNIGIAGGVVISYRNASQNFGKIGIFTSHKELNSILTKVQNFEKDNLFLDSIITTQNKFNLDVLNKDYPNLHREDKRLESNIFNLDVFSKNQEKQSDIKILGLSNLERVYMFIDEKYIDKTSKNLSKYKVVLPKSYGTGIVSTSTAVQLIGTPLILNPNTGYTRTFIGIGTVNTQFEANSILKYIKTKFCRIMLGVLKVTQDNNPEKWKYVPLQDFTEKSEIDWSKSTEEIDKQLYKKYGLTAEEIAFIETHVKEMD